MLYISSLLIFLLFKYIESCPSRTENQNFTSELKSSSASRNLAVNTEKHPTFQTNKIDHTYTSMDTSSDLMTTVATSTRVQPPLPQPPFDFAQLTHTCEDTSKALHSLKVRNKHDKIQISRSCRAKEKHAKEGNAVTPTIIHVLSHSGY